MAGKAPKNSGKRLAAALVALKAAGVGPGGNRAYGRASRTSEGTIARARRGDGNMTLDTLDLISGAIRLEAWQLLVPAFDPIEPARLARPAFETVELIQPEPADMKITLAAAEVARHWDALPPEQQKKFKRQIEVAAALSTKAVVLDRDLEHLAAPGTPTAKRAEARAKAAAGKAAPKRTAKTGPGTN